jgi:hypothetical protein
MDATIELYDQLIRSAAHRLTGQQRRLFEAEVADALCNGSPRAAERRFGLCRDTVATGQHEARSGIRCVEDNALRGKLPAEVKDPQLAIDIRAIVEPHTLADPERNSARRYTHLSAREVLQALQIHKGYVNDCLPSERSMRDILNRMGYRLKRIQKAKPLKKLPETDAVFDNIDAVKKEYENDPETLEISYDAKAKVNEGDYSRGGKREDRLRGGNGPGLGSRPAAGPEVDTAGDLDPGDGSVDGAVRAG